MPNRRRLSPKLAVTNHAHAVVVSSLKNAMAVDLRSTRPAFSPGLAEVMTKAVRMIANVIFIGLTL